MDNQQKNQLAKDISCRVQQLLQEAKITEKDKEIHIHIDRVLVEPVKIMHDDDAITRTMLIDAIKNVSGDDLKLKTNELKQMLTPSASAKDRPGVSQNADPDS